MQRRKTRTTYVNNGKNIERKLRHGLMDKASNHARDRFRLLLACFVILDFSHALSRLLMKHTKIFEKQVPTHLQLIFRVLQMSKAFFF